MSITYLEAEDEVFGIVNTSWLSAIAEVALGYEPKLFFPDAIVPALPVDQIYALCNLVVVTENQVTLSRYQGLSSYESVGLASVQIYSPKNSPSALRTAKTIGGAINDAFCKPSPSGKIWFRGQRLTPVAGNATRNQVNLVVTCTYRTTK